ncbi:MAG: universal stress protein [Nitrososphaerota archaeon]
MEMLATEQEKGIMATNSRKILVYLNGSEVDSRVLESAAKMAIEEGAELVIMTVLKRVKSIPDEFIRFVNSERFVDPPHYLYYKYVGEAILAPHLERLRALGVPYEVQIEIGDRNERIEAVARSVKPYRLVLPLNGWRRKLFPGLPFLKASNNLKLDYPITLIP